MPRARSSAGLLRVQVSSDSCSSRLRRRLAASATTVPIAPAPAINPPIDVTQAGMPPESPPSTLTAMLLGRTTTTGGLTVTVTVAVGRRVLGVVGRVVGVGDGAGDASAGSLRSDGRNSSIKGGTREVITPTRRAVIAPTNPNNVLRSVDRLPGRWGGLDELGRLIAITILSRRPGLQDDL